MNMNWLAKIIEGKSDEFVHAKFLKYGIGEHIGPTIKLSFSKSRITFKGDLDTEKTFVRGYLRGAPEGSQKVSGMIVSYSDRREEFNQQPVPLDWKKSKGKIVSIFKSKLKGNIPLDHLQSLVEVDDPTTFFLLSLSPSDGSKPWKIATKTSFPKGPKKEAEAGKEKDPVFVKGAFANTDELYEFIMNELLLDFKDEIGPKVKKIAIRQRIIVEDIQIPDDPEMSFSEKRKLAKKKGRLIREAEIDGEIITKEYHFLA